MYSILWSLCLYAFTNLQHNTRAEGSGLTSQICAAYKGANRPQVCDH